jgi:hypothetical protein
VKKFREICVDLVLSVAIVLSLVNFRWIAMPFLAIAIGLSLCLPTGRGQVFAWLAWAVLLVSFFSPVDLDPFHAHMHSGNSGKGVRLVRLVYGMPRDTKLLAEYGEYYSGGCRTPPWPAQWILTWD